MGLTRRRPKHPGYSSLRDMLEYTGKLILYKLDIGYTSLDILDVLSRQVNILNKIKEEKTDG